MIIDRGHERTQGPAKPWQFSLRSLLLMVVPLCAALALAGLKLRQDFQFEAAEQTLGKMQVRTSITASSANRTSLALEFPAGFADADLAVLMPALETLTRSRDLGLSPGLELTRVDFTSSSLTTTGKKRVCDRFPDAAEVRE